MECLTCGKITDNKKEFYEVTGRVGLKYICKECAAELGYNNFFSVGIHTNTDLLKKYVKIHPEAQERLDLHIQRKLESNSREIEQIKGYGEKIKGCIDKIKYDAEEKRKYKNCKKMQETEFTCKACGNIYYVSLMDDVKNFSLAAAGLTSLGNLGTSIYITNNLKDRNQCPKCGSTRTTHREIYFYVDKKGNLVE